MEKKLRVVSWWDTALQYLEKEEPQFRSVIKEAAGDGLLEGRDLFRSMLRAVCGQQVNNTAAMRMQSSVLAAAKATGERSLVLGVLKLSEDALRECGLTVTKARAIAGLARGYAEGRLTRKAFSKLTDSEVKAALQTVKGVGPWTADMILIFGLNRPDVFAAGDFGVRESFRTIFTNPDTMLQKAESWRPYRTAATWLLWRSRSKTPVRY